MNLLNLTNAFIRETGATDVVQTITEASDDVLQAVHWINHAWILIQGSKLWPFRWAEGSVDVAIGKVSYTTAELSRALGDTFMRDSWYHVNGDIQEIPYTEIRDKRRLDTKSGATPDASRITHVSLRYGPLGPQLDTYPAVDETKTLAYDYWTQPTEMVVDTDTPVGLPSAVQMMLVHHALVSYGALEGGQEGANQYSHHGGLYTVLRNQWETSLPLTSPR